MAQPKKRDPVCPICRRPIRATDKVSGRGDNLVHAKCDAADKKRAPR